MDPIDWSLDGKVAVVTGTAEGGIGASYAARLAHAGAHVVCADIRADAAQQIADAIIAEGGRATAKGLDVSDEADVSKFVEEIVAELGGVDVLVNNAALMAAATGISSLEMPREGWDAAFGVNVTGVWLLSRAVAPSMRERGGGRIVNISSIGAFPPLTVYGITKQAVTGITVMMAKELGQWNITVNAIAPGHILSDAGRTLFETRSFLPAFLEANKTLPKVDAEPDELGGLLLLLTTPAGAFITGEVIRFDGGVVLRP